MSQPTDSAKNDCSCKCRWGVVVVSIIFGMLLLFSVNASLTATDGAAFCGSCHVMSEATLTHKMSAHAKIACNDCHLPAQLQGRLPSKAAYGMHDVMTNAFGRIDNRIFATQLTKDIVQSNCRRCHEATTMTVDMTAKPYCTDCHRQIPHMRSLPIAKREAADV